MLIVHTELFPDRARKINSWFKYVQLLVGSNILKGKGTTLISSQVEPYILINKNIQYRTVQTNSTSLWNIIFRLQNNLCFFYFVLNIQNNLSFLILFWIFCFFTVRTVFVEQYQFLASYSEIIFLNLIGAYLSFFLSH